MHGASGAMRCGLLLMGFCGALIFAAPARGEVYTDAELKVSIPFGKSYDYSKIKVRRVIAGDTI